MAHAGIGEGGGELTGQGRVDGLDEQGLAGAGDGGADDHGGEHVGAAPRSRATTAGVGRSEDVGGSRDQQPHEGVADVFAGPGEVGAEQELEAVGVSGAVLEEHLDVGVHLFGDAEGGGRLIRREDRFGERRGLPAKAGLVEGVLAPEVGVQRRLGGVGRLGDCVHRGRMEADPPEDPARRVEQLVVGGPVGRAARRAGGLHEGTLPESKTLLV
ncbi:MAG TPA: hypothetical protein VFE55_01790 [Acidimicrobiia bacterium]|nr:hypothetical protein [Acidimicrobiia bacterium]